ncbi:N-acetylmuramoyl-L-alanine amidase [Vagococcus fessus]|uniref:N-acetylmuramoyl-L-alanine amidase n=1 Tax=Vagococcus fessus TaxID=120370 RepID=UPI0014741287|nr:N-acetylmuramoyl-L-alanine amidase [Vagococcus fessus]
MKNFKVTRLIVLMAVLMGISVTSTVSDASSGNSAHSYAIRTSEPSYKIDTTYKLGAYEGSSQKAVNNFIVLHEVGVDNSPAINNAIFMKREWSNNGAYTSFIVGDGGKVYQVGEDGYVQWGAGTYMNNNSPVQIELARTNNKKTFEKDYKVYVTLARDMSKKYNIPLTLDSAYPNRGIKTHLWVTQNIWGDHQDPYAYLARWGITKAKLSNDIKVGIKTGNEVVPPNKPNKPEKPKPPVAAPNGKWIKEKGTFKLSETINLRNKPDTSKNVIMQLDKNQEVKYDQFIVANQFVWIRQPREDGTFAYMATGNVDKGVRSSYWGTFK